MSLYEQALEKIKDYLAKSPSQEELRKFLDTPLHNKVPQVAFHQMNIEKTKQATLVYVQLMVQDIRQNCYSYPYLIQKPFSEKSKTYFFKYGLKQAEFNEQLLTDENYFNFIEDRETITCTPVLHETEWVRDVQKNQMKNQIYQMITDKLNIFKLGEVFSAICVFDPETQLLHFIRKATQEEQKTWNNINQYLSKELNFQQTKEKLLKVFNQHYSQRYSQYLLYSLISTEHLFLSASQNNVGLFKKLLKRVCQVKIQAPFKESLFPYKDLDQKMIQAPMQMSSDHTYVILDFSQFSNQKEVKIQNQEIDNLKALKIYVEQGQTVYRWIYGQSLIKHNNTGLIVKASSILNPQYVVPQKSNLQQKGSTISQLSQSDLRQFRCYIEQVRKIRPVLKSDRETIEKQIHLNGTKFNEMSLIKVMELSMLNAKSKGSQQIKFQDFQNGCKLFF